MTAVELRPITANTDLLWGMYERDSGQGLLDDELVYFIQGELGGPIKIGRSRRDTLDRRVTTLQTGYPDKLVVRTTVRGGHREEGQLHARFNDCRLYGEWFRPVSQLAEAVGAIPETEDLAVARRQAFDEGFADGKDQGSDNGYIDGIEYIGDLIARFVVEDGNLRAGVIKELTRLCPGEVNRALRDVWPNRRAD